MALWVHRADSSIDHFFERYNGVDHSLLFSDFQVVVEGVKLILYLLMRTVPFYLLVSSVALFSAFQVVVEGFEVDLHLPLTTFLLLLLVFSFSNLK